MRLASSAFRDGEQIPKRYTADGEDLSVPLSWWDAPPDTEELALVMDDPDAPRRDPWVHWVLYGLTADCRELPEGIRRESRPLSPDGAAQGTNSFSENDIGYRGPAPPPGHGPHHYRFTLYALDRRLDLPPGATKDDLVDAMHSSVLATARLTGLYERE